jgi:hypothetical protein
MKRGRQNDTYRNQIKKRKKMTPCEIALSPYFSKFYESPSSIKAANGSVLKINPAEFTALVQSLINFVPSIQSKRYLALDTLFPENFNLCKLGSEQLKGEAAFITYSKFRELFINGLASPGLYPVGGDANGMIHYYAVIDTRKINRGEFINWFSSRGELHGYNQDRDFVSRALEHPLVILNGYIKGDSPLDRYTSPLFEYSLGANIQPSQSLCAFNAVLLGLAFGLPPSYNFIKICALETCKKLQLGRNANNVGNPSAYIYNEREVLTFLASSLFYTGNPSQTLGEFTVSLSEGAGGRFNTHATKFAENLIKKLAHFIIESHGDVYYVNIVKIFKIILSMENTSNFVIWSTDGSCTSISSSCGSCSAPRINRLGRRIVVRPQPRVA